MTLPIHSIRWRIQAWHGLLLLLVLAGFGAMAYHLQDTSETRHLDAELHLRISALFGNIARQPRPVPGPGDQRPDPPDGPPEGDPDDPPERNAGRGPRPGSFRLRPELAPLFASDGGSAFYYRVWTRDGAVFGSSPDAPAGLSRPERPQSRGGLFRSVNGRREAFEFTPPGESALVGVSEAGKEREMLRFAGKLAAVGAGVIVLGLAGGWWLASRAIRPVDAISATAARIAGGRLDERIPVSGNGSELDRLAAVLNHAFAQLDAAFAEQARFTSDAAHELRTPVSVILAQTQLALARPRDSDEYRESIEITRRSALRMQSLIESLLALARLDARTEPARRQPCDLASIGREQLDLIQPLAAERGIVLHQELEPAVCVADPDRVAQICTNLLSNAVKYNRIGGEVRLSSRRENGHALLTVTDTGLGIAAQHLPHIFDRFYRADDSRNRSTGGAGLGLAICKLLTEAEGGSLTVNSVEDRGSTFTLQILADENGDAKMEN